MKILKVKNLIWTDKEEKERGVINKNGIIVGHQTTDEPEFAKLLEKELLIHKITPGSGIHNNDYTYFVVKDEDIDKLNDHELGSSALIEVDRKELDDVHAQLFPEKQVYREVETKIEVSLESMFSKLNVSSLKELLNLKAVELAVIKTSEQVNVGLEIELKSKRINYAPCGTNFSGNYNGITMAHNDVCTAAVGCNDGYTWLIPAGATIYFSSAGDLTNNGKVTWVGTATGHIIIKSNLAAPTATSGGTIYYTNVDTASAVAYVEHYNLGMGCRLSGTTSSTQISFNNLYFENCRIGIGVYGSATYTNAFSNIKFFACSYPIGFATTTAYTCSFTNMEEDSCYNLWADSNASATMTFNGLYIHNYRGETSSNVLVFDMDNCLFTDNQFKAVIYTSVGTTHTVDGSIFSNSRCYFTGGAKAAFTGCDFIGIDPIGTNLVYGGGDLVDSYVAGAYGYMWTIFDTYVSGTSTVKSMWNLITSVTSIRTTRKFPFTPASISVSAVGNNTATIDWNSGFKTKHRVKIGTVSGTYTSIIEPDYDWTNWSGIKTIMTSTPSIVLNNLKSGQLYYYVVESYDHVFKTWVTSAEGDFTTTSSDVRPVITSYGVDSNSKDTGQILIVSALISGIPTKPPMVTIKKSTTDIKGYPMYNTTGTTYVANIKCLGTPYSDGKNCFVGIATCINASVYIDASNAGGAAIPVLVSSTLTVIAGVPCFA